MKTIIEGGEQFFKRNFVARRTRKWNSDCRGKATQGFAFLMENITDFEHQYQYYFL